MLTFWNILSLICALSASLASGASAPALAREADSPQARAWADSVYHSLSERERIAQLVVPRLDITDNAAGRAQLRRMVEAGVGGILLGKGTIADYTALVNYGQELARVPLMVTLDGEWGPAMRVTDALAFPRNMTLGAISDPALLYDYGRQVGLECRALGITVDFAPVADVNTNPDNPVIGTRSFGQDAAHVAELVTAFSRGMESEGVMSVAKHFPGHGDTSTDSHKTLPLVSHSRSELDAGALVPFRRYVGEGLSGVMVGHLNVPALDGTGTPASLSRPVVTGLLRDEMGFGGLVFTDALAMAGAKGGGNNCVEALRAGVDVLLQPTSPLADIEAVEQAVRSGRLSAADVKERCLSVLRWKYALGLAERPQPVDASQARAVINGPEAKALMQRLAQAAVTVVKNESSLLPVRGLKERTVAVVSIGAGAVNAFSEGCRRYCDCELYGASSGIGQSTLAALRNADVVIAAVMKDDKGAQAALAQLDGLANVVPVFFINPYRMSRFATSIGRHKTLVAAYADTPALMDAASQIVFGGTAATGHLPVTVKGVGQAGAGVSLPAVRLGFTEPGAAGFDPGLSATIDTLVARAVRSGAMPGCQVLVAKGGKVVHNKAYGRYRSGGARVTPTTLYDLASMTKATATTGGIMRAVDEGLLSLDDAIGPLLGLPDSVAVGRLTVRELLVHETGLPPSLNIYKLVTDPDSYSGPLTSRRKGDPYTVTIEKGLYGNRNARLRSDLVADHRTAACDMQIADGLWVGQAAYDTIMGRIYALKPGAKTYKYSDLNFCLLAAVEEAVTGVAHDQWVDLEVFQPLGAYSTLYRPTDAGIPTDAVAPTEHDAFLRRQTMQGYVHDETASFLGGVSGNAGLFSTALDVAKYAQMLLQHGSYGGEQIIGAATADLFTGYRTKAGRALGFDLNRRTGATLWGHTGFTGTCFWVDPERDLIFVFLSNRVHPTRSNGAFASSRIRQRLLDAVYDALR